MFWHLFQENYRKQCLRYLRSQGWKIWDAGAFQEYGVRCGERRALVIFANGKDITELRIRDWQGRSLALRLQTYIFCEAVPPSELVRVASDRQLSMSEYTEIALLKTTETEREAERQEIITDKYRR